ncbi:MAG: DsbA family protein [Solirubrobacteraceae bacterium]
MSTQPVFYYDLADPQCYLAGEQVMAAVHPAPEWEPVYGAGIGIDVPEIDSARLATAVAAAGLQPLRLPRVWPPDSRLAMLAATFAKRGGRAVAFSLAAFRQAFAGGRDLGDEGTVLIAAAACEIHPKAVLKATGMRSVASAMQDAGRRAQEAGVRALPAVQIGSKLYEGAEAVALASGRTGG